MMLLMNFPASKVSRNFLQGVAYLLYLGKKLHIFHVKFTPKKFVNCF